MCIRDRETAAPVDVNVMALKGPTAMGMVEFMSQADTGELTDNNYHFSICLLYTSRCV